MFIFVTFSYLGKQLPLLLLLLLLLLLVVLLILLLLLLLLILLLLILILLLLLLLLKYWRECCFILVCVGGGCCCFLGVGFVSFFVVVFLLGFFFCWVFLSGCVFIYGFFLVLFLRFCPLFLLVTSSRRRNEPPQWNHCLIGCLPHAISVH